MKVYYTCLLDTDPKFQYQCWLWVHSLIELAKIEPENIWVHYIKGVNPIFLSKLNELRIMLKEVDAFGDRKYCNKIAQLSNEALKQADLLILMDTDMIVTKRFEGDLDINCVSGKIVDHPNPDLSVLKKIFTESHINYSLPYVKTDLSEELTIAGNFNGGLYIIPQKYISPLCLSWKKWAVWLLDKQYLHEAGKGNHVDQVSFCMAVHENEIPLDLLKRDYNYPMHLDFFKDEIPIVIHYHWELSQVGLLNIDPNSSVAYQENINRVNEEFIKKHFDNLIFWNFRYSVHPELGSGIGSRGKSLEIKKDFLKRLNIEANSVLDIGFGDLELMKDFQIKSYFGIDYSDQAVNKAKAIRPSWEFFQTGSISIEEIPTKEYVVCFDVLIHQKSEEEFNNLISLMTNKTEKRLLVSGYSKNHDFIDQNHMISYHHSLHDKLKKCGRFESIIKLFGINDADYYCCDIEFEDEFWREFLYNFLIERFPKLYGKKIYLHIGTPKTGTSSLQKYLYTNRKDLYKKRILYPDDVFDNKHQSLINAMLNNSWLDLIEFFDVIAPDLDNVDTIIISTEGFYNYTSKFSKAAKMFWHVIGQITDLKVVVYLRKQSDYLESLYRQCVINPRFEEIYGRDISIDDLLQNDRIKANLDYKKSLETWVEVAGFGNILVRPYRDDTIKDFLNILDIKEIDSSTDCTQNLSLPSIAVELVRRCNSFLDDDSQQLLVAAVKDIFLKSQVADCFVSDQLKERINKKYASGNKNVTEKWPAVIDIFDNSYFNNIKAEEPGDSFYKSTGAPNDMSSEDLKNAIWDTEYPAELIEIVEMSRKVFGWYTKQYSRIYEYPWVLHMIKEDIIDKKIIELGAGLSALPLVLAKHGAQLTTVDNHANKIEDNELFLANEWGFFDYSKISDNITSLNITVTDQTFPDKSCDVWYSISVIEHLPADVRRKLFSIMQKSLKENGKIILTLDLIKASNKLWKHSEGLVVEAEEIHGTLADVESELQLLGFHILESRRISLPEKERTDLAFIYASL